MTPATFDDVKWRSIDTAPKDGTPIAAQRTVRYLPYKPDGKRQMKADGRWQEHTGFGWKNCEENPDVWLPLGNGDQSADSEVKS